MSRNPKREDRRHAGSRAAYLMLGCVALGGCSLDRLFYVSDRPAARPTPRRDLTPPPALTPFSAGPAPEDRADPQEIAASDPPLTRSIPVVAWQRPLAEAPRPLPRQRRGPAARPGPAPKAPSAWTPPPLRYPLLQRTTPLFAMLISGLVLLLLLRRPASGSRRGRSR